MFQVIQFCDDVMVNSYGGNISPGYGDRLHRAVQREIQESMLTTPNGTEGFEDFEDTEPYMPSHISVIDEKEFIERYYGDF